MCLINPIIEQKSDDLSDRYREEGNKKFISQNLDEKIIASLWLYNKALCFAVSNVKLALAYANRSMFYLALKKYDECLQNIQWAREHGYPADKASKLNEREAKCIEAKAKMIPDPEEDPWTYFKLSHPANPKIPFIVDCLEYRPDNGGGIYTTRDLKAGDFIAIEPAAYRFLDERARYIRCCRCLKTAMSNCIPCLKNASLMYCSETCREITYASVKDLNGMLLGTGGLIFNFETALVFADNAFGGRDNLQAFLKKTDIKNLKKTIFDFDLSDDPNSPEYMQNMLQCILSLKPSFKPEYLEFFDHMATHYSDDALTRQFLALFSSRFERNKICCEDVVTGHGLLVEGALIFPFMRLFKHACGNNIHHILTDTNVMYYAAVPIKAGQQLFINYLGPSGNVVISKKEQRHESLMEEENLHCKCFMCANNIDMSKLNSPDSNQFWMDLETTLTYIMQTSSSYKILFKEAKKLWRLINEISDETLSLRVELLRIRAAALITQATCLISYPCNPDLARV